MTASRWIAVGAIWTALGVVLGAFGAHALNDRLVAAEMLANWKTAVEYQVWHGLALVLFGLFRSQNPGGSGTAWGFLLGSLAFSGSIYGLCLNGPGAVLGPITPLGGAALIVAWLAFARSAGRAEPETGQPV